MPTRRVIMQRAPWRRRKTTGTLPIAEDGTTASHRMARLATIVDRNTRAGIVTVRETIAIAEDDIAHLTAQNVDTSGIESHLSESTPTKKSTPIPVIANMRKTESADTKKDAQDLGPPQTDIAIVTIGIVSPNVNKKAPLAASQLPKTQGSRNVE